MLSPFPDVGLALGRLSSSYERGALPFDDTAYQPQLTVANFTELAAALL